MNCLFLIMNKLIKRKILFMVGTRPEVIKIAPVLQEFKKDSRYICYLCNSGQHKEMMQQSLHDLDITADFDLAVMTQSSDIFSLSSELFNKVGRILKEVQPDLIFVQGDTATVLISSICAYLRKIPIAHIEAGLRTGNLYSPHPEEGNRKMVAAISDFHFAPTDVAAHNLKNEGIDSSRIYVTGNTVIDTVKENDNKGVYSHSFLDDKTRLFLSQGKKMILVTSHRRENLELGLDNICKAIISISKKYSDLFIVFPVHLNPIVRKKVFSYLSNLPNVLLLEPLPYHLFLTYIKHSYLLMTDSGGIQEEAPYFDKPVLVLRENTERPEGLRAGTSKLIGVMEEEIKKKFDEVYTNKELYESMAKAKNPFGDGSASKRIKCIIDEEV